MEILAFPAVAILFLCGFFLLVSRDWRLSIAALAIQYGGVFVLVSLSWPLEMAVVKLVAGWMSGAVLGMAFIGSSDEQNSGGLVDMASILFRFLVALLVGLIVISLGPSMALWLPGLDLARVFGGFILIGMGLLHLGLVAHPFRVILGLLTVLAGFEVLYAAVEPSTLVSGMLAGVNLGLALVGAYLQTVPTSEEAE